MSTKHARSPGKRSKSRSGVESATAVDSDRASGSSTGGGTRRRKARVASGATSSPVRAAANEYGASDDRSTQRRAADGRPPLPALSQPGKGRPFLISSAPRARLSHHRSQKPSSLPSSPRGALAPIEVALWKVSPRKRGGGDSNTPLRARSRRSAEMAPRRARSSGPGQLAAPRSSTSSSTPPISPGRTTKPSTDSADTSSDSTTAAQKQSRAARTRSLELHSLNVRASPARTGKRSSLSQQISQVAHVARRRSLGEVRRRPPSSATLSASMTAETIHEDDDGNDGSAEGVPRRTRRESLPDHSIVLGLRRGACLVFGCRCQKPLVQGANVCGECSHALLRHKNLGRVGEEAGSEAATAGLFAALPDSLREQPLGTLSSSPKRDKSSAKASPPRRAASPPSLQLRSQPFLQHEASANDLLIAMHESRAAGEGNDGDSASATSPRSPHLPGGSNTKRRSAADVAERAVDAVMHTVRVGFRSAGEREKVRRAAVRALAAAVRADRRTLMRDDSELAAAALDAVSSFMVVTPRASNAPPTAEMRLTAARPELVASPMRNSPAVHRVSAVLATDRLQRAAASSSTATGEDESSATADPDDSSPPTVPRLSLPRTADQLGADEIERAQRIFESQFVTPRTVPWIIDDSEVIRLREVGSGGFATVWEGTWRAQPVAVKVLRQKNMGNVESEFRREFEILRAVRATNLVLFYGIIVEPDLCLVTEYCSNGSLYDCLTHPPKDFTLTWSRALEFMSTAAAGLASLHNWQPQVLHKDLKSHNMLLDDTWRLRIADFGLARFQQAANAGSPRARVRAHERQRKRSLGGGESSTELSSEEEEDGDATAATAINAAAATHLYSAPEVWHGRFTAKSDVFSLAVIYWEIVNALLTGAYSVPYHSYGIKKDFLVLQAVAERSIRPVLPPSTPPILRGLFNRCWSAEPDARPSAPLLAKLVADVRQEYDGATEQWDDLVMYRAKKRFSGVARLRGLLSTSTQW